MSIDTTASAATPLAAQWNSALSPAGWYQDPVGPAQRWWDGQRWTDHVNSAIPGIAHPAAPQAVAQVVVNNSVVVATVQGKSVAAAFFLTLFFGPLGMFYSTVVGGLVMGTILVFGSAMVAMLTFGFGIPIFVFMCWFACLIWASVAASHR